MEERVNELQLQVSILENEIQNLRSEKEDLKKEVQSSNDKADTYYKWWCEAKNETERMTSVMKSMRNLMSAMLTKDE